VVEIPAPRAVQEVLCFNQTTAVQVLCFNQTVPQAGQEVLCFSQTVPQAGQREVETDYWPPISYLDRLAILPLLVSRFLAVVVAHPDDALRTGHTLSFSLISTRCKYGVLTVMIISGDGQEICINVCDQRDFLPYSNTKFVSTSTTALPELFSFNPSGIVLVMQYLGQCDRELDLISGTKPANDLPSYLVTRPAKCGIWEEAMAPATFWVAWHVTLNRPDLLCRSAIATSLSPKVDWCASCRSRHGPGIRTLFSTCL